MEVEGKRSPEEEDAQQERRIGQGRRKIKKMLQRREKEYKRWTEGRMCSCRMEERTSGIKGDGTQEKVEGRIR